MRSSPPWETQEPRHLVPPHQCHSSNPRKSLPMDIALILSYSIASASGPGAVGQVARGGRWLFQGRWALSWGLSLQSLIVPGKSPTRKKSGPFGSRRSSAIGIENIQEVQEKRWVGRVPCLLPTLP